MTTLQTVVRDPTRPRLEHRDELHYASILVRAAPGNVMGMLPDVWREVVASLKARSVSSSGSPFVRYVVTRANEDFEIEVGVPVARPVRRDARVRPGVLPAGPYVTARTQSCSDVHQTSAVLEAWAERHNVSWKSWTAEDGIVWAGRTETFLDDASAGKGCLELACLIAPPAPRIA